MGPPGSSSSEMSEQIDCPAGWTWLVGFADVALADEMDWSLLHAVDGH